MRKRAFFSIFAIVTVFLISCRPSKEPDEIQVFRYNESKGISTLDPAFARNQSIIWPVSQIFNGLLELDENLEIQPSLAHSWEISDDGKVYTFYLRRDVRFHSHPSLETADQQTVNASDVEYSFSRILDPEVASPGLWIFNNLDRNNPDHPFGFKALNDSVFRIWLKAPFPALPGLLTMPYCYVVPEEVVKAEGADFSRQPVGTGPFLVRFWKDDEMLVLLKNDDYFEKDSAGRSLPYLDAINISFIKDKQSEFMEFLLGNLEMMNGIHPSYKDELLDGNGELRSKYHESLKLITQDYLNTEYLGFLVDESLETARTSPVSDRNIRKAINFGFSRSKMMRYLRNNIGTPALHGFIPAGFANYRVGEVDGYDLNRDSVRYYLEKAGYPEGKGLPEILLTTTSDYLDLCEFIQYELSLSGIRIRLDVATGASFRNQVANSELVFFRGSWIADYPDPENYLSLFYSGNFSPFGPNYTHFSHTAYDSLYLQTFRMQDEKERFRAYRSLDRMIVNEAPVVPLYYDQVVRFTRVDVKGLTSGSLNQLSLKNVSLE